MTQELEQAIALLLRRFREDQVPENDLVKTISLSLNWAKPSQAPHLLERAVQAGLLEREEDLYTPAFDPNDVEIPFGFRPPEALFEEVERASGGRVEPSAADPAAPAAEGDGGLAGEQESAPAEAPGPRTEQPTEPAAAGGAPVLEALLDRLAERFEDGRTAAAAAVNAKQSELDEVVTLPAAALIVATERGLDVREEAEDVLDGLKVPR